MRHRNGHNCQTAFDINLFTEFCIDGCADRNEGRKVALYG